MFGQALESPQDEGTAFSPVNPYAAAKVYAHHMVRIYRGSYGMFIASGVLFNHESERRPLHFLTQKIAYGAACASLGIDDSPDLKAMIKANLVAERVAIETYSQIISLIGDKDSTTRRLLEDILSDEQEHAEELKGWLASD